MNSHGGRLRIGSRRAIRHNRYFVCSRSCRAETTLGRPVHSGRNGNWSCGACYGQPRSRGPGERNGAVEIVNARDDDRNLTCRSRVEVGWSAGGYLEASDVTCERSIAHDSSACGCDLGGVGSGGCGGWMANPCDRGCVAVNCDISGAAWIETRAWRDGRGDCYVSGESIQWIDGEIGGSCSS